MIEKARFRKMKDNTSQFVDNKANRFRKINIKS